MLIADYSLKKRKVHIIKAQHKIYTDQTKKLSPQLQDTVKPMVGFSNSDITAKTQHNSLENVYVLSDIKTVSFKYYKLNIFCIDCRASLPQSRSEFFFWVYEVHSKKFWCNWFLDQPCGSSETTLRCLSACMVHWLVYGA